MMGSTPLNDNKRDVLLVEDSEDDAYFFGRTLQKSGIDCEFNHVSNGAEAMDYLRAGALSGALPKVVFLDLKMPVLGGFEVLEWIKSESSIKHIVVVVLSGSDQPRDKQRAQQLGASDYLVKPLKVSDLDFLRGLCAEKSKTGAPH